MARFKGRPLAALDRIYRFIGSPSRAGSVAVGQPVQVVHDVSRESEVASGKGFYDGFMVLEAAHGIGGGGGIGRTSIAPYTLVQAILLEAVEDFRIWIVQAWAEPETATAFTLWDAAAELAADFQGGATSELPILVPLTVHVTVANFPNNAGTGNRALSIPANDATSWTAPFPFLLPPGSLIRSQAQSTGDDILGRFLVWVGPTGTRPPRVS